jgi:hypothetical protein
MLGGIISQTLVMLEANGPLLCGGGYWEFGAEQRRSSSLRLALCVCHPNAGEWSSLARRTSLGIREYRDCCSCQCNMGEHFDLSFLAR